VAGVDRDAVAALQPAGAGLAQRRLAGGGRVARQALQVVAQARSMSFRRGVLGLADAQADGLVGRVRRDVAP
jgi:hypothetical protein